jgi:hypothetical protein
MPPRLLALAAGIAFLTACAAACPVGSTLIGGTCTLNTPEACAEGLIRNALGECEAPYQSDGSVLDSGSPANTGTTTDTGATSMSSASFTSWSDSCSYLLWSFDLATTGSVTGYGLLNIYETKYNFDYEEQHPLSITDFDPYGAWTHLSLTLSTDIIAGYSVSGVSSSLLCDRVDMFNGADDYATRVARIYDDAGALQDCVIWGHDPNLVLSNGMYGGIVVPQEILDNCTP